jgi:hypothetical protein
MANQDDTVYWTNALVHTGLRALILWPFVRFVGGVEGARGIATTMLAAGACTGAQIMYERTTLPRLPLQGPRLIPTAQQPTVIPGVVIDVPEGSNV